MLNASEHDAKRLHIGDSNNVLSDYTLVVPNEPFPLYIMVLIIEVMASPIFLHLDV